MGFHVADGAFVCAAVGEFVPEEADGPILVADVADELEPTLRHAHGHAVIEADATFCDGGADAGHTADILGDGQGIRADGVDDGVGEGEVGVGILIHGAVEVHPIVGEVHAQAMVEVEHGGDAIEAETVEVVLIKPEAAVGEEEVEDVRLAVVEATGVPGIVPTAGAVVEVLIRRAVEKGETIALVLDGVGMDNVHDDGQAHAVRLVHQRLQLLRRAETGARGEEVGDVVAEAAIVRVLHDAHQLERVVAGLLDAGEDLLRELGVSANTFGLLRHAHVRLVN